MTNPILVEVTRGAMVESVHRGSIAIMDADGNLRLALGDVQSPVYSRSSLKPMQAMTLVESGHAEADRKSTRLNSRMHTRPLHETLPIWAATFASLSALSNRRPPLAPP